MSERKTCDQCDYTVINGFFCHEHGCPNSDSRFDSEDGVWVAQVECFECGSMFDEGSLCCEATS